VPPEPSRRSPRSRPEVPAVAEGPEREVLALADGQRTRRPCQLAMNICSRAMSAVVASTSNNPEWRPLVYTLLTIVLYVGLGVLAWRSARAVRRTRRRVDYWRYAIRSRLTRKRLLREAAERFDALGVDNRSTVPPAGEHLLWPALWMVEVFLPTHAEGLARSIKALGWDQEGGMGRSDALKWLREARASGGPSTVSPGSFLSPRPLAAGMVALAPRIEIPETFRSLGPTFIQLGPGVTVLVARFTLAEQERSGLEDALREPAKARAQARGWTGHHVSPASVVRLERLGDARERVRRSAAGWMGDNLRGVFAERGSEPPSWDLITSEREPLSPPGLAHGDWRQGLGLGFGGDRWTFDPANEDLVLATPGLRDASKPKPTFFGLRSKLIEEVPGTHPDLDGAVHMLAEQATPIMALWGVVDAVREYDVALSEPRDRPRVSRESYGSTRRYLEQIRSGVLPAARDLATVQSLAEFLDEPISQHWFAFNSANPTLIADGPARQLLGWLRERLVGQVGRARTHADEVTGAMRVYGEVLVASSNLKLQRRLQALTFVLAILTAAGVWIGIEALKAK
jgi:hypothetical protein